MMMRFDLIESNRIESNLFAYLTFDKFSLGVGSGAFL